LHPGNRGRPSQFPRKHDPVRAIQFNRRFHAITMARSCRICKLPSPVSSTTGWRSEKAGKIKMVASCGRHASGQTVFVRVSVCASEVFCTSIGVREAKQRTDMA
jgi:hypothetical protein